ncbi:MAG: N-acetylneuraminate synthase family protein [Vicinamibacterales bacterium]
MLPDATQLRIGGTPVGDGAPLFVIAEIGLNHDGSVERALALVDAAAEAGASAVKVQVLEAEALVAPGAPAPVHVDAPSLVAFFRRFELSELDYRRVAERARRHGLAFIATPLSEAAVDLMERVGVDAYKIASGDITWTRLIERAGATGKPVILSTGMAALDEAQRAVLWAVRAGARGVALLHCVSAYPVPTGSENLRAIATLGMACPAVVGLSDHGHDTFAVPLAVAMGAALYERHLVLHHDDGSVDAAVSSTPEELAAVVRTAARAAAALGTGLKACLAAERPNLAPSRRALHARRALPAGHVVSADDLIALRPALGLGAERQRELVGRRLTRDVPAGASFDLLDLGLADKGSEHVA